MRLVESVAKLRLTMGTLISNYCTMYVCEHPEGNDDNASKSAITGYRIAIRSKKEKNNAKNVFQTGVSLQTLQINKKARTLISYISID
jgi:hypothetical protein